MSLADPLLLGDSWVATHRETPIARIAVGPKTNAIGLGLRWAGIVTLWIILGLSAGLVASVGFPYLFGYRSLTVLSGSMEPTLHVGDVLVVRQVSPLDVRVGDVVSFRDPSGADRLITHRVRSVQVEAGSARFVTKGDSNTSLERWRMPAEGTVGRIAYRVPRLGYAIFWLHARYGRLLLIAIPAALLGAYELVRIWRPRRGEGSR